MSKRANTARSGKPPSQRQLRVGEELRHAMSGLLARTEFRDPALAGQPITVTEVRVSPDLRNATVYVSPLTGEAATIVPALQHAGPFLRRELAHAVELRHVPTLTFVHDQSFEQAQRIGALLHTPAVERDLGEPGERAERGDDDGS